MLFAKRLVSFLWKSVTFYQESSQWVLRHNRSPGISPGRYRGGCSRFLLYYAYNTGTNLCLFVPTAGRSSLLRLFVKTSVLKQVFILHLLLIKTDNFECSHFRGTSLNITDAITTKYCKRDAFLRVHNTFRVSCLSKIFVLLRVAHGKVFQRGLLIFFLAFRKLNSVEKNVDVMSSPYLEVLGIL
jgi:hypothetical protein